ncbi:tRNA glutamyl-Q(34) synthetase GluQRS [Pseudomonas sp. WN033]|nr:tRNA glutamyl-Q(34) synthetase GluQRS [Pseudomonas sp. WN033]
MPNTPAYIGRFAPTPSGQLHFGSLLAALASYLDARQAGGQWLVRIEDLDLPRNLPGAADQILQTLDTYGLHWDATVLWQSQRTDYYQHLIDQLLAAGQAFYCDCSRRELQVHAGIYPGTCRQRQLPAAADRAIRVQVDDHPLSFIDRLQGPFTQRLQTEVGDFIIRRRDGIIAYQLAVVADDIAQQVSDVVRGADLLDSTPRQLWLYQLLGARPPRHLHIPLAMRRDGEKLSKRLASTPLAAEQAPATLFRALQVLAQEPPAELAGADVSELLGWATSHWQPERLPARQQLPELSE